MAGGRPTDWTPALANVSARDLASVRHKWTGVSELKWCRFAMERQRDWVAVTGKEPFDRFDFEYPLMAEKNRKSGVPRVDAVGWRGNKATLIEAKTHVSPASAMQGVGQLMYYKHAAKALMGWDVEELILFTPSWPLFLIDTVRNEGLPVTLVMATPEEFYCSRYEGKQ